MERSGKEVLVENGVLGGPSSEAGVAPQSSPGMSCTLGVF